MLILEALRRSKSPHEIDFLLTCYVDGLQFYAMAERLPAEVMTLPVRGLEDAEDRLLSLRKAQRLCGADAGSNDNRQIMNEVTEVFSVAVRCLANHARRDPHDHQLRRGRRPAHHA